RSLDDFPSRSRMIDGFTNRALRFGEEAVAEVDAMKPRFKPLEFRNDFVARHCWFAFSRESLASETIKSSTTGSDPRSSNQQTFGSTKSIVSAYAPDFAGACT